MSLKFKKTIRKPPYIILESIYIYMSYDIFNLNLPKAMIIFDTPFSIFDKFFRNIAISDI